MRAKDRVVIGWLDPGQVDSTFAVNMAFILAERRQRVNTLMRVNPGGLLSKGRNELVRTFLDTTDAEWLLIIDSDEQLSVESFDKLCREADHAARPIMAGLYFGAWPGSLYPMPVPLIFKATEHPALFDAWHDYPRDKVVPIDSAGTGCLLVHRRVFEALRRAAEETDKINADWCWFRDGPADGYWLSEDHYFCSKAREAGFKLYAHTGAVLPHRKGFWQTDKHHDMYREAARLAEEGVS